jgi:hypothetical protein
MISIVYDTNSPPSRITQKMNFFLIITFGDLSAIDSWSPEPGAGAASHIAATRSPGIQ